MTTTNLARSESPLASWQLRANHALRFLHLPDLRLETRAKRVLGRFMQSPGACLARAAADRHEAKRGYSFFANERVSAAELGEAIYQHGAASCAGLSHVYIVQDTTTLTYGERDPIQGLGPVTTGGTQGLLVHSSLAISPAGVPLGLVGQYMWTRKKRKKSLPRHKRPLHERESRKWVIEMKTAVERLPEGCHPIFVFDREGDIHETLAEARSRGWGLIVRSQRDRCVQSGAGEEERLWAAVRSQPVAEEYDLEVPRKKGQWPSRTVRMALRYCTLTLDPHCHAEPDRKPVEVSVVLVTEQDVPPGLQGLEWCLVTTEPVESAGAAREIAVRYGWRWRIEELHLIQKSGCRIEAQQFDHRDRIEKVVVLLSEVALGILRTSYWSRVEPEAPATLVLDEYAIQALRRSMRGTRNRVPEGDLSMGDAVRLIGRLGGHLGRKCDGPVGVRTMWQGWTRLQDMALMLRPCPHDSCGEG